MAYSFEWIVKAAFQYVAVPPIPSRGVGMNDAKIQNDFDKEKDLWIFFVILPLEYRSTSWYSWDCGSRA